MPHAIAIVVGSLRADSFNRRLAQGLTRLPAAQGVDFRFPEIGDLPLYNQDDDANPSAATTRLKAAIRAVDGVIFVSPEYNRSIPGVLKNALDHASRPYGDSAWAGKPAGVIGTSEGASATAMMQQHLRAVLAYLDMPTLNQPEAFVRWNEDTIAPDGAPAGRSAVFLDKWMKAFLGHVERHRQGA